MLGIVLVIVLVLRVIYHLAAGGKEVLEERSCGVSYGVSLERFR